MERGAGIALDRWLEDEPRPWRAVLDVFVEVAGALARMHAAGAVHGDLRPERIRIGAEGGVSLDAPGASPGAGRDALPIDDSARYMAPEQFRGGAPDARSDQFSYCVALYRGIYRQPPFDPEWAAAEAERGGPRHTPLGSVHTKDLIVRAADRTTVIELAREVLAGNVRPPPPQSEAPDWLEDLLRRGLRPDPGDRFPSMEALLEAVSGALAGRAAPAGPSPRRPNALPTAAAIIAGLAALVTVIVLAGPPGGQPPVRCGDGVVGPGEECDDGDDGDDGNATDDACLPDCRRARCGDGKLRMSVEQCDDGNLDDGDGCNGRCERER